MVKLTRRCSLLEPGAFRAGFMRRFLTLVVGVLVHIGIHGSLMVAFFSAASIWAYLAYLPYDWVEKLERWWAGRRKTTV